MEVLYVFTDESGNLDFSSKGTKFFVFTAVTVLSPIDLSNKMQELKYNLLHENDGGTDFECFHASEDNQATRNRVFDVISNLGKDMSINYIYAEKSKTNPSLHSAKFYSLLGETLIKYLLNKYSSLKSFDKIVFVIDKALSKKEQNIFLKELKPKLKEIQKPYAIYFHRTISDFNSQIADYCSWAKYVSLERGEMRPLDSIKNINIENFDIFSFGKTKYY